jgi:diaminohydroxyphosphoribosylaminopyrimidine deaminase / 5-amino-6-(5-phosphoribosylamino)uracil reductase
LADLKTVPKRSTLYVTLEPCVHFGKTPPCADYVIARGIDRVVIGSKDPNPLVGGKGIARLRQAGIRVVSGVLEEKTDALNKEFNYWIRHQRPYVTVKMAQSLDGKIATPRGQSRWISGRKARALSHRLRARSDAVLVGIGTVLKDDPALTVRGVGKARSPIKIVLDSYLETPPDARLFREPLDAKVLLAACCRAPASRKRILEKKAVVLTIREKRKGFLDCQELMTALGKLGIVSVLAEGGSQAAAGLLKAGVVQEIYWVVAPIIIGGADSPGSVGGVGPRWLRQALKIKKMNCRFIGNDLLIHGVL